MEIQHIIIIPKDLGMFSKGDSPYIPMTWGWDVSTINPTIFRKGSGFLGQKHFVSLPDNSRIPVTIPPPFESSNFQSLPLAVGYVTPPKLAGIPKI